MNENTNFSQIPANACIVAVGEFQLGDNGPNAKTAPVRLVARSGKPIEHWFWGRVVHDMAGMHLHKSRLPIDYVHDSKEVIGFLNHFETESGDLVTSGALVPYGSNDRASEIIHKMREGVPYEASINFGGDGIKVQELAAGEMAEVNGAMFDGPGVIVREWPLRGVAVCPYGADANTESKAFGNNNSKTFSASVIKTEQPEPTKEATAMSEAVENVASEPVPEVVVELDESKPGEVVSEEAAPVEVPVESLEAKPEAIESEKPAEVLAVVEEKPADKLSRDEFLSIVDKFGADIAAQVVKKNGGYVLAIEMFAASNSEEVNQLRAQLAENQATRTGTPVAMTAARDKAKLFKTGK